MGVASCRDWRAKPSPNTALPDRGKPRPKEAHRSPINLTDCPMYTKNFVNPCPDWATALLNGFSQVLLLRNPLCGLCCLLAILLTAPNLVGGALMVLAILSQLADSWPTLGIVRLGFKHGSTHVANLFALCLGLSIIALSLRPRAEHGLLDPRTLTAGVLGTLLACSSWYLLSTQAINIITREGDLLLEKTASATTQDMQSHLALMQRMADRINAESKGALEVQIFPNAQLGGEKEMAEGMRLGSVCGAPVNVSVMSIWVPEGQLFDMPFLFRDDGHAYRVLAGDVGKKIAALYEPHGFKVVPRTDISSRSDRSSPRLTKNPDCSTLYYCISCQ